MMSSKMFSRPHRGTGMALPQNAATLNKPLGQKGFGPGTRRCMLSHIDRGTTTRPAKFSGLGGRRDDVAIQPRRLVQGEKPLVGAASRRVNLVIAVRPSWRR